MRNVIGYTTMVTKDNVELSNLGIVCKYAKCTLTNVPS